MQPRSESSHKMNIHDALEKVLSGEDLSRAEIEAVITEFFSSRGADVQLAAFMTALSMKGATAEEEAGIEAAWPPNAPQAGTRRDAREWLVSEASSGDLKFTTLALTEGDDLSRKEAEAAMEEILSGQAANLEIAAFLAALRFKGETVDELVGFATAMRRYATPIFPAGHARAEEPLVDTAGTGGDARGTFNISTAAAFVIAGAGVRVAKHGNRSISSSCGSADVLEELGVAIDLEPERVGPAIE